MATSNQGGNDERDTRQQDEDLGTRRKIGYGNPAPAQEFESSEPGQQDKRKGHEVPKSQSGNIGEGD